MIVKRPEVSYNTIAEQIKRGVNSLTLVEWNFIINSLRVQANVNADQIKYIHSVLFGLEDVSIDGVALIPELYDKIYNGVIDRAAADGNGNNIINTYATKTELADLLELIVNETVINRAKHDQHGNVIDETYARVADVEDGTTVVNKALKDDLGNTIKSTYANKLDLVYSSSNNRIAITLKSYDGNSLDADLIDLPKATTSADGLLAKEDKVKINNIATDIASMGATKQSLSEKNQINGYAGLDGNAKIPSSLLPDSVLGQLEYKGTFTPTAYPLSPEKGWFYISIGNGTIGGVDFQVGDWAVFNGSTWDKVDNTDAVMSVNGKLGVVILNGTDIPVGNGDTWTIEQRIVNLYAELNNRYTKAQTYSNAEIEQRITDLLGLANLQDVLIGTYTNGQTVLVSDLSSYNFVIALGKDVNNTYTGFFKPSEIVSGNVISLSSTVNLTRGATDFTITTPTSVKLWGIKLDGISADEISYLDGNVEEALDSLLVPAYVTATHEALQTEITATNAFEINDETGDVIKITGNEPTNLVVNGDFSNGTNGWTLTTATGSVSNGIYSFTATGENGRIQQVKNILINTKYYAISKFKANSNLVSFRTTDLSVGGLTLSHSGSGNYEVLSGIYTQTSTANVHFRVVDIRTSGWTPIEVDYMGVYNVSDMILKGVKADDGRLLGSLTDGEIKSQLDIWVENGFPTVVEKLVSKSDNLFNAEFNTLSSLDSENLVDNGDLLLDSNSDGVPNGFSYINATDISLTNGIAKFTATATLGRLNLYFSGNNQSIYIYSRVKTNSNKVAFTPNVSGSTTYHSGSGQFEHLSSIATIPKYNVLMVLDYRTSAFTPIEVDYIGAINITDLVSRGILPAGLTNNEYKELIDNALFENVPLRETNYIAVEPSKAYKLIKVSANEVTHKVIEYTTDNQVVKVTPVVYTTNKFTFTTNALTSKIKLVSDLMKRPVQLISNGTFDTDTSFWQAAGSSAIAWEHGRVKITYNGTWQSTGVSYTIGINNDSENWGNEVYVGAHYSCSTAPGIGLYSSQYNSVGAGMGNYTVTTKYLTSPNNYLLSAIYTRQPGVYRFTFTFGFSFSSPEMAALSIGYVDNVRAYNITEFKTKGVVNDSGTLFSRLTKNEIKAQMDIWTEVGFPDHVIAALYPNGVDSAIALKYNDADDIFRPQQIDELPLNLTLRSGEYWQDGYVVKQNGNAEYHPLQTKFSAWNYGQLEAVYTSGLPADFDIQYAQNTAAQVKTTQEFLVEAREQLETALANIGQDVTDILDSVNELLEELLDEEEEDE